MLARRPRNISERLNVTIAIATDDFEVCTPTG